MREREHQALDKLGWNPVEMLQKEVRDSLVSFTGMWGEEPVVIYGAKGQIFDEEGYIWAFVSDDAKEHPRAFVRNSRAALAAMRPIFRHGRGFVLENHPESIRWLEWLGAEFETLGSEIRSFRLKL